MGNTRLKALLISGVIFCLFSNVFAYSGGTGEPNDPYQIADANDLLELAADTNDYNDCFILINDINLAGQVFTTAIIAADTVAGDYAFDGTAFTGAFDGNGRKITNFTISGGSNDYIGLFGYIASGGSVKNLGLENFSVSGSIFVGGLVGRNYSSITNCYAAGMITGKDYIGGLVGDSYYGIISNCYSTGAVIGDGESYCVGGLVGDGYYGSISNCYSTGTVSGSSYVGGLVGINNGGSISNCYSMGAVSGSSDEVGGLVGSNGGGINNCYSTGAVDGDDYVGGLVGKNWGSTIENCYSTGTVSGSSNYVGGLVGFSDDSVFACFWDTQTSGRTASAGGRGLTTSQMKSVIYYQNSGWADKGWVINDGLDYPRLVWENTGGIPIPEPQPVPLLGSGTEEEPFQVWTTDDLVMLNQHIGILDKYIALMTDLDLSGITFYPIGDMGPFAGVFEGNGFIIRNVHINNPIGRNISLFGYVGSEGQIYNLGIEDVNIIGDFKVGGLVGSNYGGSISNCYSTGKVSCSSYSYYVGGLVGSNYGGSITNCYSTSAVDGSSYVGGLVGGNGGSINNCYATGSVSGNYLHTGGLVGVNNGGSINNCYSMGAVSGSSGSQSVGGLVGMNSQGSSINNCYSTCVVSGPYAVGGLVGYNSYSIITNCYSTSAVNGNYRTGGLVGDNLGSISNCYSTGTVSSSSAFRYIGGLVGHNSSSIKDCYATGAVDGGDGRSVGGLVGCNGYGSISNCYATGAVSGKSEVGGLVGSGGSAINSFWDIETSGQTSSAGGTGKTTAQMQDIDTFTSAGWDFDYGDGDEADWFIQIDEYPILVWQISPADIYTDGRNDFRDFAIFAQFWMRDDCAIYNYYCDWADLDFNGSVDIDDLAILMDYWLERGIY